MPYTHDPCSLFLAELKVLYRVAADDPIRVMHSYHGPPYIGPYSLTRVYPNLNRPFQAMHTLNI